jgi:putative membrane protein
MVPMKPSYTNLARPLAAALLAATLCTGLAAQVAPTPTPTPADATMPTPTPTPDTEKVSHHDKEFLKKAAKSGMTEVAISEAVMDHLSNADLKAFAQQMVTDHTAANNELASLAATKGVMLPPQDPDLVTDWSKKTDDVDKTYVKKMVSDHESAVKLFEKASKSTDADIAAFAQKTLPTLQHHLMMAQDLKTKLD